MRTTTTTNSNDYNHKANIINFQHKNHILDSQNRTFSRIEIIISDQSGRREVQPQPAFVERDFSHVRIKQRGLFAIVFGDGKVLEVVLPEGRHVRVWLFVLLGAAPQTVHVGHLRSKSVRGQFHFFLLSEHFF